MHFVGCFRVYFLFDCFTGNCMYETTVTLVKFSYIRICMCTGFYLGFIVRGRSSGG